MWGQSNWQQNSDMNIAYFHHYASQRKEMNLVSSLQNDSGQELTNITTILDLVVDTFHL